MRVIYEPLYDEIAFTPPDLRDTRRKRPKAFIKTLGSPEIVRPKEDFIDEKYLLLAHSEEYVNLLKKFKDVQHPTPLDFDTYAYPGFFDHVLHTVAGTLTALEEALERGHAFNPQGGLHHAHRSSSAGFCPVNDVAIAAIYAAEHLGLKVAVVDYDGHHGDGTQEILRGKDILRISVHDYGIYPGTGRLDEIDRGFNVNVPLAHYSADPSAFLAAELIEEILEEYNPDVIIVQSGADGRHGDPLTTLRYSVHAYISFAQALKMADSKLAFTAGGGYTEYVPLIRKAAYLTAIGESVEPFESSIEDDPAIEENARRIVELRELL